MLLTNRYPLPLFAIFVSTLILFFTGSSHRANSLDFNGFSSLDRPMAANISHLLDVNTFQSDDFKACSLNEALWSFTNPKDDSSITLGTNYDTVQISVPAGEDHEIWGTGLADFENNAPRIMQPAANSDFEIEIKFDSGLSQEYQKQGVLIEQDSNNLLRFEFFSNGTNTRIYAAIIENGAATSVIETGQSIADVNIAPLYMRVQRTGNSWTQTYSFDGDNWFSFVTFSHNMTVTSVGAYGGNTGEFPPEYTTIIDYFFNNDAPIVPEDGNVNTLTINTVGNGLVTSLPDLPNYNCFQDVTLNATANQGWSFSNWSGDLTGSTNPETLTITGDHSVTANFTQDEYALTIQTVGSGSVSAEPDLTTYHYGDVVTLTATADVGWTFSNWSGDLTDSTNPTTLTITGEHSVTANFTQDEYALTTHTVGNGSVSVEPDLGTYHYGDVVTLTAIADPDWFFSNWSGDLTGSTNPRTLTITGDHSVTANFTQGEYTLTIQTVGSGSVLAEPDQAIYQYGDVVTLTATADMGWTFSNWSDDLTGSTNPETLTITGDHSVTAIFAQDEYTLTIQTVGSGSVLAEPDLAPYHYGDVVTLTATADVDWAFSNWSGDLTGSTNPTTLTVTGDHSVTAIFVNKIIKIFLPSIFVTQ